MLCLCLVLSDKLMSGVSKEMSFGPSRSDEVVHSIAGTFREAHQLQVIMGDSVQEIRRDAQEQLIDSQMC